MGSIGVSVLGNEKVNYIGKMQNKFPHYDKLSVFISFFMGC